MNCGNLQRNTASRIAVIVNPDSRAGSRGTLLPLLKRRFGSRLDRVQQVSGPEESTELTRQWIQAGVDTIVAAGGDGTVNAVVNGIVGNCCRLGIIPTGTANDLASNLALPKSIDAACTSILQGAMRTIDVVRVNGWHFVTAGGIGLPVSIIETVEKLRRGPKGSRVMARLTGSGLYALAMFYHTFFAARLARTVEVRIGTQFESLPLYALLIANMSTIGRYMRVAPEAHVADGHLRVVTFGAQSPWHLATAAMRTLNGSHGGAASVRTFTGRCVTLRTDTPTPFCADGETRLCDTSFKIEIVPNALSLICPL